MVNRCPVLSSATIEREMAGLTAVIELLAQPRGQFVQYLARIDGRVVTLIEGEDQLQLA